MCEKMLYFVPLPSSNRLFVCPIQSCQVHLAGFIILSRYEMSCSLLAHSDHAKRLRANWIDSIVLLGDFLLFFFIYSCFTSYQQLLWLYGNNRSWIGSNYNLYICRRDKRWRMMQASTEPVEELEWMEKGRGAIVCCEWRKTEGSEKQRYSIK